MPGEALHALLDWEKSAIVKVAEDWGEIDRSHRKLAHRASRLDLVHMSESSVLRVLTQAGIHLPEPGPRQRRPARAWPEWAELVPGVVYIYDFTHFPRSGACAVAVMAAQVDRCTVNGEEVVPQPGGFYGGWITSWVVGPFKGVPGSSGW